MKRISLVIMSVVALCAIAFVGCEKNSDVNPLEIATDNYVFVNPKWILVDEDYCDAYGNCGVLYVNANNEKETKLEVDGSLLQNKKCEVIETYGNWVVEPVFIEKLGAWKDVCYCDYVHSERRDCQCISIYDNGTKISTEIIHISRK